MIKKNLLATVLVTIFIICLGQFLKGFIEDYGIMDMCTISDMEEITFEFESVFNEEHEEGFQKYHEEYVSEALAEEFIAIVSPTGNITQRDGTLKQEVEVIDMLKGDSELEGETIMLQDFSGIQHYFSTRLDENDEEYTVYTDNNLYYIGVANIMRPENTYVAFFRNEQLNDLYISDLYELNGIFAYFKLDTADNLNTVTPQQKYTLNELKEFEYFSSSKETLQSIYSIKKDILEQLNIEI